ncbi:multicopper oxidase family protein [Bacillus sp. Marseille-Q3570]|uniref:multicopper oxidase family protein n=1 Tax=Bacillus sp. Marseille-Q3570 TaxID=2963522 RepID=UPI0021B7C7D8|nr:multicopper oxidase [Bacillus sp. Marseille-Q3570]
MKLSLFTNPLPTPKVLRPIYKKDGIQYYEVTMKQAYQNLHKDLPDTIIWGYQGIYPGPLIEVEKKQNVQVKWMCDLPGEMLLPLDKTVHGAHPPTPEVRTVVHLHGAKVRPENDGYPDAWFTTNFNQVGPFFTTEIYEYPNDMDATMLWYHDHAIGITRLNIYAGLAGMYIIRDKNERNLNLPEGKYEIPLLIQDRAFNPDGTLFYPAKPGDQNPPVFPSVVPEFFGDTILVNGKVWPYLEVEPRKYRLRMVNGSNARFFRLSLSNGASFYQIGTDGGLMEYPVEIKEFLLSPGERIDVIVDFSLYKNQTITLKNTAKAPFPEGDALDPSTTGQIMQFKITIPITGIDTSVIPKYLRKIKWLVEKKAMKERFLTLVHLKDEYGRPLMLLDDKRWDDPITEKPGLGTIEIWNFINISEDSHPIHLHLIQFQILSRQSFDVDFYNETGELKFTGEKEGPLKTEKGWKDVVNAHPGEVTRIIGKFQPYAGRYVWHCHMLEHEDQEMMRPYEVIERPVFPRLLKKFIGYKRT